ncbi:hypothetical protein ACO0QE_004113 [Hanseniaspora vineae]
MTKEQAVEYAQAEIPNILPYLDRENIVELCTQVLNNNQAASTSWNNEGIAEGFIDILGASDASFDFIFKFNEKLNETTKDPDNSVPKEARKASSGMVASSGKQQNPTATLNSSTRASSNITDEPENPPHKDISLETEAKQSTKKSKNLKIENLNEVESYLKTFELNSDTPDSKACNCQGARHGLFELVPNCLNCGKIICMKEGKNSNNCSFCKNELLPMKERLKIIELLEKEKKLLNQKNNLQSNNAAKPATGNKKQVFKLQNNKGGNFWESQEKFFNQVEKEKAREKKREQVLKDQEELEEQRKREEEEQDESLKEARKRLNTLLHYQDTSAERTKIIDNASDYSIAGDVNGIWGSGQERALMVKRQQRNLKKLEKLQKERAGRDKVVVDISINKDGKAVLRQKVRTDDNVVYARDDELLSDDDEDIVTNDVQEIQELEDMIRKGKEQKQNKLSNSIWDFKKDQEQFKTPVYTATSIATPHTNPVVQWKNNKVQISKEDSNLEENILAVL